MLHTTVGRELFILSLLPLWFDVLLSNTQDVHTESTTIAISSSWNDTHLEKKLFDTCSPTCENNGICRMDFETMQPVCLCPLDYTGSHCEKNASRQLKECNENTCLNGGSCTGTRDNPSCSCPESVSGITCERRIRSYSVHFLMLKGTESFHWDDSLADNTSSAFQKYSKAVTATLERAAKLGSDPILVRSFVSCENVTFTPGSVWVTATLKFDFNNSMAAIYSSVLVLQHLQMGGFKLIENSRSWTTWIPTDFGSSNATNFHVTAIDPCESNNHDCSRNAICKTVFNGVYACECYAFTIDVSSDRRYPGRRCVYDGLIIFTFVTIGIILSSMVFILCGCRRTIWYRRQHNAQFENVTLVKMPSNYDI